MALSAFRKAPLAALLMLGCATVPVHAGWFSSDSKPAEKAPAAKADDKAAAEQPAATLDDSVRQAQMLRLAAQYPEAIKHLSQLMMVASDDGRVISEYGKTLTVMGRASDAVGFLTRAQQLQPGDWTIYSALGVAYDQMGDQKNAQTAYEQALAIKPGEPSVLNNYALSRMLAKDPETARKLAARAESAGGTTDAKIARNIAMIRSLAPETAATPAPVARNPAPQPSSVASNAAPVKISPLPPVQTQAQTVTARAPETHGNQVVMQPVPVDPLAGPVHSAAKPNPVQLATKPAPENLASVATQAPRPLQFKPVQAENLQTKPDSLAKTPDTDKAVPATVAKVTPPVPVKAAVTVAPTTVAKVTPIVPAAEAKSATPPASVKAAEVKPTPVKTAEVPATVAKVTPPAPVKAAEAKPATPPVKAVDADKPAPSVTLKLAPPAPVKAAEADKPASLPKVLPSKTVAKDAIPGLRMSANAY